MGQHSAKFSTSQLIHKHGCSTGPVAVLQARLQTAAGSSDSSDVVAQMLHQQRLLQLQLDKAKQQLAVALSVAPQQPLKHPSDAQQPPGLQYANGPDVSPDAGKAICSVHCAHMCAACPM